MITDLHRRVGACRLSSLEYDLSQAFLVSAKATTLVGSGQTLVMLPVVLRQLRVPLAVPYLSHHEAA